MRKKVLVLGGNFGGLTAALAVKHELDGDVDVTVVSKDDQFLFNPSLIWLPFGKRDRGDLTFPIGPTLESHDVAFEHVAAAGVDADHHQVTLADGRAGLRLPGHRHRLPQRRRRRPRLPRQRGDDHDAGRRRAGRGCLAALPRRPRRHRDRRDPGRAGCFGAAYEFLFNTSYQLRRAGLHKDVRLSYVTSEPFLGHFGIGGLPHGEQLLRMFLKKEGITAHLDVGIDHVASDAIVLGDGTELPSAYSMVVPPFLGQEFLLGSGLTDEKGYVKVRDTYQTEKHDDVYAVGIAAAVDAPWQTPTPVGIPKTGFPTEAMAHTAAKNIAAQIRGEVPSHEKAFGDIKAICVMDAGNNGVVILADKMLPPRKHGALIPGPQAHLMKLGFEKYFIWKMKHGYVQLP